MALRDGLQAHGGSLLYEHDGSRLEGCQRIAWLYPVADVDGVRRQRRCLRWDVVRVQWGTVGRAAACLGCAREGAHVI